MVMIMKMIKIMIMTLIMVMVMIMISGLKITDGFRSAATAVSDLPHTKRSICGSITSCAHILCAICQNTPKV